MGLEARGQVGWRALGLVEEGWICLTGSFLGVVGVGVDLGGDFVRVVEGKGRKEREGKRGEGEG